MGRPAEYPAEFRREAVALVKSSGRPVAEVTRSLEIAEGTLWNWVKLDREATERAADPDALSESELDELKRRRKKTAQQEIDLEILRKAAANFASDPDIGGHHIVRHRSTTVVDRGRPRHRHLPRARLLIVLAGTRRDPRPDRPGAPTNAQVDWPASIRRW